MMGLGIFGCQPRKKSHIRRAMERFPMLNICQPEGAKEAMLCGALMVYENRETREGKKIPINVVVVPTYHPQPPSIGYLDYNGGPGVPNESNYRIYQQGEFSERFRMGRDILVIDPRGTGASALHCAAFDTLKPFLATYQYDINRIKSCLEEIRDKADLTQYNTPNAVEDLEEVRAWLGFEQLSIAGISYGTRVALEYMRRYPTRVHSMILTGSVPPSFGILTYKDREIERLLQTLIARCASDSLCQSAFPGFRQELYGLKEKLATEPVRINSPQDSTGAAWVEIDETTFIDIFIDLIDSGDKLESIPLIIHEAYQGNFKPFLASNLSHNRPIVPLFYSQFCPEEAFRTADFDSQREFAHLFTEGHDAQRVWDGCNAWLPLSEPGWLKASLKGDAPLLLISGEMDIITPPGMNEKIRKALPNSRHIIIPGQGHTPLNWECWDELVYQFLESGDLHQLDTTCLAEMRRPDFITKLEDL